MDVQINPDLGHPSKPIMMKLLAQIFCFASMLLAVSSNESGGYSHTKVYNKEDGYAYESKEVHGPHGYAYTSGHSYPHGYGGYGASSSLISSHYPGYYSSYISPPLGYYSSYISPSLGYYSGPATSYSNYVNYGGSSYPYYGNYGYSKGHATSYVKNYSYGKHGGYGYSLGLVHSGLPYAVGSYGLGVYGLGYGYDPELDPDLDEDLDDLDSFIELPLEFLNYKLVPELGFILRK